MLMLVDDAFVSAGVLLLSLGSWPCPSLACAFAWCLASEVALGSGLIELAATLAAARAAGVSRFFVEDESSDVLSEFPRRLRWLESLAW
jgi:hypothetical protein